MGLSESERKESESYLSAVERLMGDERTRKTFHEIVYGISGLRRLMDQITTEAILEKYLEEQVELPPCVLRLLETFGDTVHR